MTRKRRSSETGPDEYWEHAGKIGYEQAMYASADVETHVRRRLWNIAVQIGDMLGIPRDGYALDLGCGDGGFSNEVLAHCYAAVDAYDKAQAAIHRAKDGASGPHVHFNVADILGLDYSSLPRYDGAFLIGILHHVKWGTPAIVKGLKSITPRVVVLEPNGDNLFRKLLEVTPSYRAAGEESFRTKELVQIFNQAGYKAVVRKRLNLFPNFTPGIVYRVLAGLEPRIEKSSFWSAICTVNMFGFAAGDNQQKVG